MNPDALSDLVLLLVCAAILWFHLRQRPAVAVAAGLIGLAACLGVLRYSGWAEMLGPHRFTSLLAACAAFPLLASGLRWPDAPLATRGAAVGRFVLVVGGVGIVLTLAGLAREDAALAALPGPGRVIGAVRAEEVNRVSGWLERLRASRGLPEKLFVLHQFRTDMIGGIALLLSASFGVAVARIVKSGRICSR